ncbi:hypothetical protein HanPSC8_Chr01g0032191 [Helianthus annuus]|nr:hypothetical protein HanPSC8_Chr01g0032191 [Helianthus annuus]
MENNPDVDVIELMDEETNEAVNAATAGREEAGAANNEGEDVPFTKKRRKTRFVGNIFVRLIWIREL